MRKIRKFDVYNGNRFGTYISTKTVTVINIKFPDFSHLNMSQVNLQKSDSTIPPPEADLMLFITVTVLVLIQLQLSKYQNGYRYEQHKVSPRWRDCTVTFLQINLRHFYRPLPFVGA